MIEQMRGRVKQVLDDPRVAVEYLHDVRALRDAVDEHGIDLVADTAAYTWFNRLTAARYMDVNGFSGLFGVVSPPAGSASALPEILTRAQAGEFPDEIPSQVQASVVDLLTGKRTSTDPDAEAYALLLSAMFASWHKPMPEVFPAAVDWIRLLTPLNMLAPTSVRAIAVAEMDAEACENVEVVGWLYQFYNSELKDQINDSNVSIDAAELPAVTQLFTPHWIVRYLVENTLGKLWLRSRPSSGLRDHMRYFVDPIEGQDDAGVTVSVPEDIRVLDPACGSGHMLTYAFDLLFRIYEEEGYSKSSIPQLILTHNLRGLEIDERAAQLASFALAMKARDKDRRFFTRRNGEDQPVQPDIVRVRPLEFDEIEAKLITGAVDPEKRDALARLVHSFKDANTFGSLIRVDSDVLASLDRAIRNYEESDAERDIASEIEYRLMAKARSLGRQAHALVDDQYHVVVANPPYLGSGNMGGLLKNWMATNYLDAKNDLLTAFMLRTSELAVPSGRWGMIVLPSWMFLKTFADFREWFLASQTIESFLHLGRGLFGSDFGSDAFVVTNSLVPDDRYRGTYRRLFTEHVEVRKPEVIESLFLDSGWNRFEAPQGDFKSVPESPIVYWLSDAMKRVFREGRRLAELYTPRQGLTTADNERFLRLWFEVSDDRSELRSSGPRMASLSPKKWFPFNKGGEFRKWWGNAEHVVNWEGDGREIRAFRPRSTVRNPSLYFVRCVSWSNVSSGAPSFRQYPASFMFSNVGYAVFPDVHDFEGVIAFLNSSIAQVFLTVTSPAIHLDAGQLGNLPILSPDVGVVRSIVEQLTSIARSDWNDYEFSWDFEVNPIAAKGAGGLESHADSRWKDVVAKTELTRQIEESNNRYFAKLYELEDEVECDVPISRISLTQNPYNRYAPAKGTMRTNSDYRTLFDLDLARELISYAVGCMMGRYSFDKPGLILADAGATITDFDVKVPNARFRPDADGIIPITAEHYFEDDIVSRMREFLAVAFGKENVEANVAWLEFALGSGKRKSLRDYFLKDFYNDHVKTYSKRPIYWQVSSNPKTDKGFNALFYLHRYTPATLGLIRENYANQMTDKQQARLETIEHALRTAGKAEATKLSRERDLLTAQRREIRDWITNKLFPLSTAEVKLDLDDGVKHNYPKLQDVLRKVPGL
ncbi:BREX-1 system adenine-specific DNA-methyltransferase PglX [Rhodococcus sp. BP-252]|uniref:BREX-1 system adenine-specific DNA-methyltransferase PglX n=1 Tax=unclassified Rhodococcus (in: high G+C Gram-positive bacteria) TaxID=192944 RepID=UPI001C9AD290|nr:MULTISPECIES: BREX-1 system adenine-specific DNA-methyltransferase PglX [unclassified Rhodococcus (in: high G+C Gram-positive bacteria)]MBY6429082.1 BREX-1 system adenine-specific DNA-methyltransferase PglX [Rhodococcus sp. BP-323]MBY6434088.1 BREX-1 system adenine-specific DNA-methyltransferase PglX [Rhodococcus sp. BP-322]MBY6472140.1 BREX-1 system adenine-specific DNA-methyltransferase PglX [Rhodococcus sp. BP-313]MBY6521414.1 BREX-1 system adenine-specific DNA-methyltransferase PglX [Rho